MSIGLPGELYAVTHRQTFEFFFVGLKEVSDKDTDEVALLYNASILAHYAQVSTQAVFDVSTPGHLGVVFDNFVYDDSLRGDSVMMETAGTQCLLLTGFFEDQMKRRHNIRWYSELGAGFFFRAAVALGPDSIFEKKAGFLKNLARNFELWRSRYARLSRELRDQPYLIRGHSAGSM